MLTSERVIADYYEEVVAHVADPKQASNWVMGPVLALSKEGGRSLDAFPVAPRDLADLIGLVLDGTVSQNVGKDVLRKMVERGCSADRIVKEDGLAQIRDENQLEAWVEGVLTDHPEELERFRSGEKRLQGFFMGQIMKASRGKADPTEVSRLLSQKLQG